MLDFDVSYFKEETRCGFTIPEFMKHAWASQLELLSKVDKICKENDIKYFANWGTVLGAVRHGGYIPWDDDIDLCMLRTDVERFCEVVNNYDDILVQNCYNSPDHGFHANRVMNSTMFTVERDVYKDYFGFPFPVGLDIFNLDYVPRDKSLEKELVDTLQVCASAAHAREWLDEHGPNDIEYGQQFAEYKVAVEWLEKNCGMKFSQEYPSLQEIAILREEVSALYTTDDADFVTEMQCLGSNAAYYIPKEVYEDAIFLPFENMSIPVPIGYNKILAMKYGNDYMMPKNVAAGHEYPFYNAFFRAIYDEKRHKTFEGAVEYIKNISSRYYIKFRNKTTDTTLSIKEDELVQCDINGMFFSSDDKRRFAAQCEVLEEFKRLCESIGIDYYAIDTTLDAIDSGDYTAVVNDGINVALKRKDLNDFLLILGQRLDPWFNYSCLYSSDRHEDMRIQIWSDSYRVDKEEFAERFHGCNEEVCLYISIIDDMAQDSAREDIRKMLVENLIMTAKSMPSEPPYSNEVIEIVEEWKQIAQINVNTSVNLKREFLRAADNIAGGVAGENGDYVRVYATLQQGRDLVYNKSDFDGTKEEPFFITTISVPNRQ
ncbi:MAG: LicD family protein [Lachnospiraceae bacterium]|nr:LicD family protein [Lachnospiraceae bacterium]